MVVDLLRAAALLTVPAAYAVGALSLVLLATVAFAIGVGNVFFEVGGSRTCPPWSRATG